jgi:hypothetical protein
VNEQQVVIQYRINGFGTDSDLAKRHQIETLLGEAFEAADVGFVDGGDIGSGEMNIFLYTHDRRAAEELVVRTLRKHGVLDGAVIAVCPNPEQDEPYEVIWPEEYDREFSVL